MSDIHHIHTWRMRAERGRLWEVRWMEGTRDAEVVADNQMIDTLRMGYDSSVSAAAMRATAFLESMDRNIKPKGIKR